VERILLAVDGIAPHYQLILRREGALDELTVRCESAGAGAGGAGLAARAEHALREETRITIRVELLGRAACRVARAMPCASSTSASRTPLTPAAPP
jgi:phenylacetate-coenzyme A ligase PaaK-like adenylate-forming protein